MDNNSENIRYIDLLRQNSKMERKLKNLIENLNQEIEKTTDETKLTLLAKFKNEVQNILGE